MTDSLPPWDDAEKAAARKTWTRVGEDVVVFENPWIRIETCDVLAPTGHPAKYGVVRFANKAVGVLPLYDDGTVSLVGQSRFALGTFSWEMPEGGVPFGEDSLTGAKRELREETGMEAANWQEILEFDMSNSVTDEVAIIYLATSLTQGERAPDETEVFDYARVPFKDVLAAVTKGQIRDGLTVAAVLRVYHMAMTGELPTHLRDAILSH